MQIVFMEKCVKMHMNRKEKCTQNYESIQTSVLHYKKYGGYEYEKKCYI